MKTQNNQKRLHLAAETLRTLRADEVQNIVGGADNEPPPFTSSLTHIMNQCCNCK